MLPLPQTKINKKAIRILTEDGRSIIDIERMSRNRDRLFMHGKLMGQFDTDVFITIDDIFHMIPMILKPGPLAFLLLSPLYWLRKKLQKSSK
ncbi:hypothetical protein ACFL9T_03770 [Thermodesulfobacteriota bacterium]